MWQFLVLKPNKTTRPQKLICGVFQGTIFINKFSLEVFKYRCAKIKRTTRALRARSTSLFLFLLPEAFPTNNPRRAPLKATFLESDNT